MVHPAVLHCSTLNTCFGELFMCVDLRCASSAFLSLTLELKTSKLLGEGKGGCADLSGVGRHNVLGHVGAQEAAGEAHIDGGLLHRTSLSYTSCLWNTKCLTITAVSLPLGLATSGSNISL